MNVLIARRKNPDLEFYDDDLSSFSFSNIAIETFPVIDGVNLSSSVERIRSEIVTSIEYDHKNKQIDIALSLAGDKIGCVSIPAKEFCDDLMDIMVENQDLEIQDAPLVKKALNTLSHNVAQKILTSSNNIVFDKQINGFGYIKVTGEGSIVSTVESIVFEQRPVDAINPFKDIILNDCIMALDLEAFDEGVYVEFYVGSKCLTIPVQRTVSANTKQGLTKYVISVNSFSLSDMEQDFALPTPKSSFEDTISFIADREKYLSTFVTKHDDDNIIDNLFSF